MAYIAHPFASNPMVSIIAHHHRHTSDPAAGDSIYTPHLTEKDAYSVQSAFKVTHIEDVAKVTDISSQDTLINSTPYKSSSSPQTADSTLRTRAASVSIPLGKSNSKKSTHVHVSPVPTLDTSAKPRSIPKRSSADLRQRIAGIAAAHPQPYGVIPKHRSKKANATRVSVKRPSPADPAYLKKSLSTSCLVKTHADAVLQRDVFDEEEAPRQSRGKKYDQALEILLSSSPPDDAPELSPSSASPPPSSLSRKYSSASDLTLLSSSSSTSPSPSFLSRTIVRTPVDFEPLSSLDTDDEWTIDDFRNLRRTKSLSPSSSPPVSAPRSPPKFVDLLVERLPALFKTSTAALFTKTPPNIVILPTESDLEKNSTRLPASPPPSPTSFLFEPDDDFTGIGDADAHTLAPIPAVAPGSVVHLQTFKVVTTPLRSEKKISSRSGRANIVGWGGDLRSNSSHLRMLVCEMQMIKIGKLVAPLKPRVYLPPRKRSTSPTRSGLSQCI